MLVLQRREGEGVCIGNDIHIVVKRIGYRSITLSFEAPEHIKILRDELLRQLKENGQAVHSVSIPTLKIPCPTCQMAMDCKVVRCPSCLAYSWIDDWEVYDDAAVCPVEECIVDSYLPTMHFLCRLNISNRIAETMAPEQRKYLEDLVTWFNRCYPVGTKVEVWRNGGEIVATEVSGVAQLFYSHDAVAWFKDIAGFYTIQDHPEGDWRVRKI